MAVVVWCMLCVVRSNVFLCVAVWCYMLLFVSLFVAVVAHVVCRYCCSVSFVVV